MIKTNILNPLREFNIKVAAKELVEKLDFKQETKIKTLKKYNLELERDLKDLEQEISIQYQSAYPGLGYSDPLQNPIISVQSLQDVINIQAKRKGKGLDSAGRLSSSPDSDLITPPMSPTNGRKQFFSSPIEMDILDLELILDFFSELPFALTGLVMCFLLLFKIYRNNLIVRPRYLIDNRLAQFWFSVKSLFHSPPKNK